MPAEAYITQNTWDKAWEMLWTLWNRDLRSVVIKEGGIKIINDGGLVGTVGMIGETTGLGYQYDGSVTSAAAVAAIHKATLNTHTTDLASQLGSINFLNEQKNLHAATLAAHGSELSSQAGSILGLAGALNGTNGRVDSLESGVAGLQGAVGGLQGAVGNLQSQLGGVGGSMDALAGDLANISGRLNAVESLAAKISNYLQHGGGNPGFPPFDPGA